MLKEFRDFAMKGNVIDMAVGVIIGAAFGKIVSSIVTDIIMPPLGFLIGNVDFSNLYLKIKDGVTAAPYSSLAEAQKAGAVTINYGVFLNNLISFLIVAWAVFLLVRVVNRLPAAALGPLTKDCQYCLSKISPKASRCPHCTSNL